MKRSIEVNDRTVVWSLVGVTFMVIVSMSLCRQPEYEYVRTPRQINRPLEPSSHDTIKPIPPTLEPSLPLSFDDVVLDCRKASKLIKLVRFHNQTMIQIPGKYIVKRVYRYETVASQLSGSRAVTLVPMVVDRMVPPEHRIHATVLSNVRLQINIISKNEKTGRLEYEQRALHPGHFVIGRANILTTYWPVDDWLRDRLLRGLTFDFQDTQLNYRIICDIRRNA